MPHRDALASLNQSLAAIDVMIRGGKGQGGRLVGVAQEARQAAETLVRVMRVQAATVANEAALAEKVQNPAALSAGPAQTGRLDDAFTSSITA
ncbi:hypothetical protein [Phreatobacter sp.]|uniref:hypothetical protein n=1 Tax=Phreatobacter sp. TaxID=1966341 RepID=UPI0025D787C9|nr:hypothetical protein [Phreatobacter sp.]